MAEIKDKLTEEKPLTEEEKPLTEEYKSKRQQDITQPPPSDAGYLLDFQGKQIQKYSNVDAYNHQVAAIEAQKRGDFALAHHHFQRALELENESNAQKKKEKQIAEDLRFFDAEQKKQLDALTRSFRTQAETETARASTPLLASTRQGLLSAGLEGGLAQAIAAEQTRKLAQQGISAQNQFQTQLLAQQERSRSAFLMGEFSFFQALEQMSVQADLDKALMAYRAMLQQDIDRANRSNALYGDIGSLLGTGLGILPFIL